jgi:anti-sigma regulatory factor (Ser/Thr protein kinase)
MPAQLPGLERSFATLQEVPGIRADLRRLMTSGGQRDHVDDVVLAATELLNNCVLHTDNGCRVAAWLLSPRGVRVEVDDYSAGRSGMTREARAREGGRGLHIVEELATAWGVKSRPDGKTVWFEIQSQPAAATPATSLDRG